MTCTDDQRATVVQACASKYADDAALTCASATDYVSVELGKACSSGRSVASFGPGIVLVNGDSMLDGLGLTEGAFETTLAEALGTTVENNAVLKACLDQIAEQRSCSGVDGCEVLVLQGGANFCDNSATPQGEVAKMTALVDREVAAGVTVVLVTYNPDPTVTDAQALWYVDFIANAWVALAAANEAVHVVDLREFPAFAHADDEATRPYRAEDNSHLSPIGGQVVATLVAEVIQGFESHDGSHDEHDSSGDSALDGVIGDIEDALDTIQDELGSADSEDVEDAIDVIQDGVAAPVDSEDLEAIEDAINTIQDELGSGSSDAEDGGADEDAVVVEESDGAVARAAAAAGFLGAAAIAFLL